MNYYLQNAKYRFLYYYKKVVKAFGYCPKCFNRLNITTKGRGLCPNCKI